MTIYGCEIFFLITQLVLAGKDATSFRMKNAAMDPLTMIRLNRWHRDGIILAILYLLPCLWLGYSNGEWKSVGLISSGAILIRLTVYDIAFNKYAGLELYYFGSTPKADGIFAKIFGYQGAVRKSLAFGILLIIFQFIL
jgi:hypothetical protein